MDVLLALTRLTKQDLDTLQDFITQARLIQELPLLGPLPPGDDDNQQDTRLPSHRPDSQEVRESPMVDLHGTKRRPSYTAADQFQPQRYHDAFPSTHFHKDSLHHSGDASLHEAYGMGLQPHTSADYSTWRQPVDSYARQWSVDSAATAPSPTLTAFHPAETHREVTGRRHTLSHWQPGTAYDPDLWGPYAKRPPGGDDEFSPSWQPDYFDTHQEEPAGQSLFPDRTSPPAPSRPETQPPPRRQSLHTPKQEPGDGEAEPKRKKTRRMHAVSSMEERTTAEGSKSVKKETGEDTEADGEGPSGDEGSGEDSSRPDDKSQKRLKNRQAAARCRNRRKQLINDLQQQVNGLASVNDDLKAQVETLAARLRQYEQTYGPPPQNTT